MLQGSNEEKLLQNSFSIIEDNFSDVVDAFYEEFFRRYPEYASLFKKGYADVRKKQMARVLVNMVKYASEPQKLRASLARLGRQHGQMGVKAMYYNQMIEVLLDVLEVFCGRSWNEQVRAAWHHALLDGAKMMIIAYRGGKTEHGV